MNPHEEKQEARRERYLDRAEKADEEAARRRAKVDTMAGIMAGTPILIGHHSEGRHRRDLARMHDDIRKSIAEHDKANHYRDRAANIGKAGISSDDPEALVKLREKLARMEEKRDRLKALGSAWRRAGKPGAADTDGWEKVAERLECELSSLTGARKSTAFDSRGPVPGYVLSNLGANMRRVRQRIETMEQDRAEPTVPERRAGDVVLSEDLEDNRIRFAFPGKPCAEIRSLLKTHGFRWAPSIGVWQRQISANGRYAADLVFNILEEQDHA